MVGWSTTFSLTWCGPKKTEGLVDGWKKNLDNDFITPRMRSKGSIMVSISSPEIYRPDSTLNWSNCLHAPVTCVRWPCSRLRSVVHRHGSTSYSTGTCWSLRKYIQLQCNHDHNVITTHWLFNGIHGQSVLHHFLLPIAGNAHDQRSSNPAMGLHFLGNRYPRGASPATLWCCTQHQHCTVLCTEAKHLGGSFIPMHKPWLTFPQLLQWWRRLFQEKCSLHKEHIGLSESGIHEGEFSILRLPVGKLNPASLIIKTLVKLPCH